MISFSCLCQKLNRNVCEGFLQTRQIVIIKAHMNSEKSLWDVNFHRFKLHLSK